MVEKWQNQLYNMQKKKKYPLSPIDSVDFPLSPSPSSTVRTFPPVKYQDCWQKQVTEVVISLYSPSKGGTSPLSGRSIWSILYGFPQFKKNIGILEWVQQKIKMIRVLKHSCRQKRWKSCQSWEGQQKTREHIFLSQMTWQKAGNKREFLEVHNKQEEIGTGCNKRYSKRYYGKKKKSPQWQTWQKAVSPYISIFRNTSN